MVILRPPEFLVISFFVVFANRHPRIVARPPSMLLTISVRLRNSLELADQPVANSRVECFCHG